MRSLAALQLLLVLCVLLPAAVLGWLGLQASDGYEAEMGSYMQRELEASAMLLRQQLGLAVAEEQRDALQRLEAAAAYVEGRLPFDRPSSVLAGARRVLHSSGAPALASLWPEEDLEVAIALADGRHLFPAELSEQPPPETTDRARLLSDLRREADTQLFGLHDPAAAVAVWTRAAEHAPDEAFRAQVEVEALWTAVRGDRAIGVAAPGVERLRHAWSAPLLEGAGRTWVQLLVLVGQREALGGLAASGRLDEIPLTRQERALVRRLLAALPTPSTGVGRELVTRLQHGLSLRVVRTPPTTHALVDLFTQGPAPLALGAMGQVTLEAGRPAPPAWMATGRVAPPEPPASTLVIEIARPLGEPLVLTLRHRDALFLEQDVARRKGWTAVAVGSLLGVVVLGLLLTRRALRREREAVRLRDDFLANVSHELRTPLTSVSLHADLLARPDLDPAKRRAHVEVVQAESARLASMVEDLLDFAALERGARRLSPEPVDLARAAERALAPYRVLAEREGVRLELTSAPGDGASAEALADAQALGRILANLVGNAFKHGRPARDGGTPHVRVLVQGGVAGACVEVRDNGPGIPREERARLFERFRRGGAAAGRPGTGLGLALSRGLARAMGGDLAWVEDARETVFRLTLPGVPATMGAASEAQT